MRVDGKLLRRRRGLAAEQLLFHLDEGRVGGTGVVDRHQRPVVSVGDDAAGGGQHVDAIGAERAHHQRHGDEGAEDFDADLEMDLHEAHAKARPFLEARRIPSPNLAEAS